MFVNKTKSIFLCHYAKQLMLFTYLIKLLFVSNAHLSAVFPVSNLLLSGLTVAFEIQKYLDCKIPNIPLFDKKQPHHKEYYYNIRYYSLDNNNCCKYLGS